MSELEKHVHISDEGYMTVVYKATEADALIAKLEAELKEAKKDAERYRWLREHPHLVMEDYEPLFVSAEKIDDAVDKAIDEFLKG